MKLVIAGSRTLDVQADDICTYLYLHKIPLFAKSGEVVSGGCPTGADRAAEDFAIFHSFKLKRFPADWPTHGKAAGPKRNAQMAEYGDALLLIWDGKSPGSANMKYEMNKLGKPVYEVVFRSSK